MHLTALAEGGDKSKARWSEIEVLQAQQRAGKADATRKENRDGDRPAQSRPDNVELDSKFVYQA